MANTLPVSRIVNVSVILTPAGAQAQSLSDLLILGTSSIIDIVERYRTYGSLAAVATDFGTVAPEYLAAQVWFGQTPQPPRVLIGRWVNAASTGGLRGALITTANQSMAVWNAVTAGQFKLAKDGGSVTNYGPLDFSAAANLNAVAAIIQGALTGITVLWNAALSRFEFTSTTTGAASAVSFLTAGNAADISVLLGGTVGSSGAYVFAGQAAETALSCVALFDQIAGQKWYCVSFVNAAVNNDFMAVAGYVQAATNKHIQAITTAEAGSVSSVSTTDIGYLIKQAGYSRSFVQYSQFNPYAALSAMAKLLTTNYNANNTVITLMFKQEPGVVYENLTSTQADALKAKSVNVFVQYDNQTAILQYGTMGDGTFADIVVGVDWLAVTLQNELFNLLYTSRTKIPQTDAGQSLLLTKCDQVCELGVTNGLLAPGIWNTGGFGQLQQGDFMQKGYYSYSASFDTQLPTDRAARHAMPIQIAAKLAGAIHDLNVDVYVNQ